MGTLTANYSFQKPTDGGDDDTWGSGFLTGNPATDPSPGLNGNWSKADALLKDFQDRIDAIDLALVGVPQKLEEAEIKVGQLLFCTWAGNPADVLGYGTWTKWEPGRTLVGVGNNGVINWTAGLKRGVSTVTLSVANLPSHTHTVDPPSTESAGSGSHSHTVSKGAGSGGDGSSGAASNSTAGTKTTGAAGAHAHTVDIAGFNSGAYGGSGAHNNVQPSKAAYIWQRTA